MRETSSVQGWWELSQNPKLNHWGSVPANEMQGTLKLVQKNIIGKGYTGVEGRPGWDMANERRMRFRGTMPKSKTKLLGLCFSQHNAGDVQLELVECGL